MKIPTKNLWKTAEFRTSESGDAVQPRAAVVEAGVSRRSLPAAWLNERRIAETKIRSPTGRHLNALNR